MSFCLFFLRLDLSNNDLEEIPECIWYLQSLKILNLAQNKLEYLPSSVNRKIGLSSLRSTRSALYNCPVLEEVYIQVLDRQTGQIEQHIIKCLLFRIIVWKRCLWLYLH